MSRRKTTRGRKTARPVGGAKARVQGKGTPLARRRTSADETTAAEWCVMFATAAGDQPASARRAVFNTYELLEGLLVELDTKTLLLSQRVCKAFKAVIDRSDLLQQALFFRLAKADGRRFGVDGINPLPFQLTRPHPPIGGRRDEAGRTLDRNDFTNNDREWRIENKNGFNYTIRFNKTLDPRTVLDEAGSMARMYPFQTPFKWKDPWMEVIKADEGVPPFETKPMGDLLMTMDDCKTEGEMKKSAEWGRVTPRLRRRHDGRWIRPGSLMTRVGQARRRARRSVG